MENGTHTDAFGALLRGGALALEILDKFPMPIEVFAPDGTSIYVNRALLELNGVADAALLIGKYNLKNDPVCNDLMGLREGIQRAFHGEVVVASDISPPVQDLVDRGVVKEKPYESARLDMHLTPIHREGQLTCVVCVFVVKSIYKGKPDAAKAKRYIESHWQEDFDSQAVAKSVNMSVRQLYNLFSRHVDMTPKEYYNKCKVEHIRERLADKHLTVTEAFAACGEDSRGWLRKVFRDITGMSPKEYRASLK